MMEPRWKGLVELAVLAGTLAMIGVGCWWVNPAAGLIVPGFLVWLELVRK